MNLYSCDIAAEFPVDEIYERNPFKGDIDTKSLKELIEKEGTTHVPIVLLTITNNTAAGQPVSMANIRETSEIAHSYGIPLVLDAARFAENAYFIHAYEKGYRSVSIPEIVKEIFSYVDAFAMSMKKDAICNIGGLLCMRDEGLMQKRWNKDGRQIGITIKEKQILNYGNDSYGGLSGRDIMAAAIGLREVLKLPYLRRRILQTFRLAEGLVRHGIPVILPPGGHAVYVNMTKFFEGSDVKIDDFRGVGLVIELIRLYGIRACELGPFAFEWDQKTPAERQGILNFVRFAIPRNVYVFLSIVRMFLAQGNLNSYSSEHIDYTIKAVAALHKRRELIPKVYVSRGAELHLRHFQSGLTPVYRVSVGKDA